MTVRSWRGRSSPIPLFIAVFVRSTVTDCVRVVLDSVAVLNDSEKRTMHRRRSRDDDVYVLENELQKLEKPFRVQGS